MTVGTFFAAGTGGWYTFRWPRGRYARERANRVR